MIVAAASPLWYLTRGSGIVTFALLTASICLGVATSVRWQTPALPRFVVAGLHRNLTLLTLVFLAIHVTTTVTDRYTRIGVQDAFIPFIGVYRPIWLGLGALACDLLLALVVTSLLRLRIGFKRWRTLHWLAYAAWPVALVHALGTGSDARFLWMAAIGAVGLVAVVVAVLVRASLGGWRPRDLAAVAGAGACALGIGIWYRSGPAQHGWAARAGTPKQLLAVSVPVQRAVRQAVAPKVKALPRSFAGQLSGQVNQSSPDGNGLVTVTIDAKVTGRVHGELRLALKGFPLDNGGVSMTASGVAFEGTGPTALYEGSIVGLNGTSVAANLSSASGKQLRLALVFRIDPRTGTVAGSLQGSLA